MLSLLRRILGAREKPPQNPDVILVPSYGVVSHERLADATELGLREAVGFARKFPNAMIAFATCSHYFLHSEHAELRLKQSLLAEIWFSPSRVIIPLQAVQNTVTELQAIKASLVEKGIHPEEVLLISEPLHARSVEYIARRVYPGVKLSLALLTTTACQSDAPFFVQRSEWLFLLANIAREAALRVFGLEWVGKISHTKVSQD